MSRQFPPVLQYRHAAVVWRQLTIVKDKGASLTPLPGCRARVIPADKEKEEFEVVLEVVNNIGKCRFNFVVDVDDFTITNPEYFNKSVGSSHA